MSVWFVFKKWLKSRLFQLSNRNLIILLLAYVALSWGMLVVSGETALTEDISTLSITSWSRHRQSDMAICLRQQQQENGW